MKIDLSDIAGTPAARGRYSISESLPSSEELSCVGPVTGEITVENTGSLLLVKGELRAVMRLSCARCLEEFERPVTVELEETFAAEGASPDVATIDREEPEASAMSEFVLDVSELARQHLLANTTMAFVCRPDCAGICPACGRNLNEGPCGCRPAAAESRWGKLAELLGEGSGGEEKGCG